MNKTKFNLIVANHSSFTCIEDWIITILGTLQAAGGEVTIEDRFVTDRVNIVLEFFNDAFLSEIESAAKRGCKIIIIATEYITGMTFNQFSDTNALDDILLQIGKHKVGRSILKRISPARWKRIGGERFGEFRKRFRNFVKAAKMSQSIWVAEPCEVSAYEQLLGTNQKIIAFPYCWFQFPDSESNGLNGGSNKSLDLFFSGSLTNYRLKLLREFEAKGFSVAKLPQETSLFIRNFFAGRARIILDLKKDSNWGYISNLRVHYHLRRGEFVVCEKRKNPCCLEPYVVKSDSIMSLVPQLLQNNSDFERLGLENLERFRSERPASRLARELLDRSGL